ncbi:hypothetical protein Scep_026311 [Stephania cephalantha]|uniref:Uncharacterized protein n=1 Tax=Stephania cephalantha TaxID=152367 RepID=A0AAP0HRY4_9MAGN
MCGGAVAQATRSSGLRVDATARDGAKARRCAVDSEAARVRRASKTAMQWSARHQAATRVTNTMRRRRTVATREPPTRTTSSGGGPDLQTATRKSAGDGRREAQIAPDDLAPGDGGAVEAGKRRRGKATRDRNGRDFATEKEEDKPVAEAQKAAIEGASGEGAGTADAVMLQQQQVTSWRSGSRAVMQRTVNDGRCGWCSETTWQRWRGRGRAGDDEDSGVQGLVQRQQADRWRTRGGLAALCLAQPERSECLARPERTELCLAQPEKPTIRALKNTTQSENNNERSKETPRIGRRLESRPT